MNRPKQTNQDKIATLRDQGSLNPSSKKVRDSLFLNETFFDANDIVQVKYELLRRVQIEGISITNAVKNFGFSRLSFYRTLTVFEKSGLAGLIPKKRGPRKAHKITADVLKFINNQIRKTPTINSIDLKKAIKEEFGLSVHPRSVERALSRKKKEEESLSKFTYSAQSKQELIDHYEGLRSSVLDKSKISSGNLGYSILYFRGMSAWIKTCLSSELYSIRSTPFSY